MNMEWVSEKGASLTAFLIGLGFIVVSILNSQYRYFFICMALCCLVYGYRQLKRRDTPFEKHERELRRKRL